MRKCIKCDARVRNHNPSPKINFCSDECKRAIKNGISRQEQIERDIQEQPFRMGNSRTFAESCLTEAIEEQFSSQSNNQPNKTMKVITEGHKYELDHFESYGLEGCPVQSLQFIEKVPAEAGSTELRTVNDGTTNEEVLRVLINRMNYLQGKFPCRENAIVITKLEESLMWLNKRTADRLARNVEGKQVA